MKFSLFHKDKQQQEPENPAVPPQEEPKQEAAAAPSETEQPKQDTTVSTEPVPAETTTAQTPVAVAEPEKKPEATEPSKTYLKAMPLKNLSDVENVKAEIKNGNIVILRVTPLASKSIDDVKNAVNELYQFSEQVGGDIARLGEERVVICPKNIRIWREKKPAQSDSLPTAPTTAA